MKCGPLAFLTAIAIMISACESTSTEKNQIPDTMQASDEKEIDLDPALLKVVEDKKPEERSTEYDCKKKTEDDLDCLNYELSHGGQPDVTNYSIANRLKIAWINDVGQLDAFYSKHLGINFDESHKFNVNWSDYVILAAADKYSEKHGRTIRIDRIEWDGDNRVRIYLERRVPDPDQECPQFSLSIQRPFHMVFVSRDKVLKNKKLPRYKVRVKNTIYECTEDQNK